MIKLHENIVSSSLTFFDNNNSLIKKLINLILQNNLYIEKDFPLILEDNAKKISLLNIKREFSENDAGIDNQILFKEEIDLCKKSLDDIKTKLNKINKLNENNKRKSINHLSMDKPKIKDNDNYEYNSIESSDNLIEMDNNINNNKVEKSIISNKNLKNDKIIDTCINKTINEVNTQQFLSKKKINFNNDVRVKKNNKIIYMNSYLIKPKILKKKNKSIENKRSSKYRGVSKNGNRWQAIMYSKKHKAYIGCYSSEEEAARVYDIMSIKTKGIKAKTNFEYKINQINKIVETEINFKSKNIIQFITKLIE